MAWKSCPRVRSCDTRPARRAWLPKLLHGVTQALVGMRRAKSHGRERNTDGGAADEGHELALQIAAKIASSQIPAVNDIRIHNVLSSPPCGSRNCVGVSGALPCAPKMERAAIENQENDSDTRVRQHLANGAPALAKNRGE
jgi:hypothetical protein